MNNITPFDKFMASLKETNATLGYFCDFEKCSKNLAKVAIKLNALNFLLGSKDLKTDIFTLFREYQSCFEVLNLLIAVRESSRKVVSSSGNLLELKSYFDEPEKIYSFLLDTGLDEVFKDRKIKNLCDYVFGVEVGLDTNARKNRSGKNFANLISERFRSENISFQAEVSSSNSRLNLGSDVKRFDFVIQRQNITYLIEANFYSSGGSKLNEVARAYIEIAKRISPLSEYKFIWITDGWGWHDARNKLQEAYKSVRIYNLANLHLFINELKNA